jgi:hypothetical protein
MNTYEISNPSDPITIQADDDMVAAAAGLLLGEGRYGIKRARLDRARAWEHLDRGEPRSTDPLR